MEVFMKRCCAASLLLCLQEIAALPPASDTTTLLLPGQKLGFEFPKCAFETRSTLNLEFDKDELLKKGNLRYIWVLGALLASPANTGRQTLNGIEVGALHSPSQVPPFCTTTYVDFVPKEKLDKIYSNLKDDIKLPDIIDSADRLDNVATGAYDYLLAFHVFEHVRDFAGAVVNGLRVLREGGVLVFAVPSMCSTFDQDRALTDPSHFLEEAGDTACADANDEEHHREWGFVRHRTQTLRLDASQPLPVGEDKAKIPFGEHAALTMRKKYPIHYHTFLPQQLDEALHAINALGAADPAAARAAAAAAASTGNSAASNDGNNGSSSAGRTNESGSGSSGGNGVGGGKPFFRVIFSSSDPWQSVRVLQRLPGPVPSLGSPSSTSSSSQASAHDPSQQTQGEGAAAAASSATSAAAARDSAEGGGPGGGAQGGGHEAPVEAAGGKPKCKA